MPTIYRVYRPQTFKDVVDQQHIVQTLTNEIAAHKVAHAYLFSGPRGIGKTSIARILAKAINCQNRKDGESEPCGECPACREITDNRHIDVIEIDAASQTGVDNVRENIIENAQFKPTTAKYKVFIIDEVHMLSTSAFNALLKTLEEPPAHVIFILATTELHKLPATIVSRCQRFNFKKIGFDSMREKLEEICKEEKVKVDKDVLQRIANKSDGCLRDAESLLGQILSLNLKKITAEDTLMILPVSSAESILDFCERIFSGDSAGAIELLNKLAEDGISLDQFAYDLAEVLRLMLISQTGLSVEKLNTDYSGEAAKKIKKLAGDITTEKLIRLIDALLARRLQIKSSPIAQLPLELLAVEFGDNGAKATAAPTAPPVVATPEVINVKKVVEPAKVAEPIKQEVPPIATAPTVQQEAEPIVEKVAVEAVGDRINIPVEEIQKKWPDLIARINSTFPSLTFILNVCSLQKVDDGVLIISVPYSFHKEKLEDIKIKKVLEDILTELCGGRITFTCDVKEEQRNEQPVADTAIDSVAADFGGEVVA